MKKSLYLASAAVLALTACNEDFSDWAPAQASTEDPATVADGSVTALAPLSGTADAENYQLMVLSSANGKVSFTKLFLNDEPIAFNLSNDTVSVSKATLDEAVRQYYHSMAPVERELAFTGNFAMVNANGEATPLNVEPVKIKYTAAPLPANAKETAYYYVGGYNGWNLAEPTPFESNGDGTYQLTINISDGEWFAFAPQSAVTAGPDNGGWDMLFRAPSNGCTDTEGFLDNDPSTGWSFNCETGGQYTFILDMNNYTFKYVHYIEKEYYYIGALAQDKSIPLTNGGKDPLENPVFTATIPALGDGWHWFKIAPGSGFNEDGSWNWDNEYKCACATVNNDESMSGKFVIGGDKYSWHLIEDGTAKFYRLSFNFLTQEYSITPINYSDYIYYAGDWTSWGDGKKELALTNTEKGIYTGYYFIKAVDNANTWGFKFIDADGNWYGGGNGLLNGDANCDPGEEGFYKIEVDWANMSYTLTKINTISFVGDVTGDSSWGTDIEMAWNGECWEYTGELKAGSFKFRANKDWNGMNWGGDPTNLEVDGANASIATAGTYTVKLYCNCLGKAYYTIQ